MLHNKLLYYLILAITYIAQGDALPSQFSKRTTHHTRMVGDGVQVTSFHPPTNYKTFGAGHISSRSLDEGSNEDRTISFISRELNLEPKNIAFTSGYVADHGVSFGYASQMHDGIVIKNAVANVAYKDDKVVAFGQSFIAIDNIAKSTPTVSVDTVIPTIEEKLRGKKNEIEPKLEYLALDDGSVILVHVFQVWNEELRTWYEAHVDAHTGDLISVSDFVAHASYKAVPIWGQVPIGNLETIVDPQLTAASPNGWHSGTATAGNNVIAYLGTEPSNTTSQSSSGLNFDYTYDFTLEADQGPNSDAARTSAFYLANSFHDTLYLYGFTESAFNFQQDNFGKGGLGNDPYLVNVLNTTFPTAQTFTPPDGQSGGVWVGKFTFTEPSRSAEMEPDLMVHELAHGLTARMTGGGRGSICFDTLDAVGLWEGWSDAIANWFSQSNSPTVRDWSFLIWAGGDPGSKSYDLWSRGPYSVDPATNPLRFNDLGERSFHAYGEVWAEVLHVVHGELVAANGWSSTARTDSSGTSGNVVWLQLVVDGLALQPCNPTVLQARDAIIQADANRYSGAHRCLLWRAFASRGFGFDAVIRSFDSYIDGESVPSDC